MFWTFLLSLRGRLIAAFAFIILLTVTSTGIIASLITSQQFARLAAEQGQYQAHEIAPLLEVSYVLDGNWEGLNQLLQKKLPDTVTNASNVTLAETGLFTNYVLDGQRLLLLGMDGNVIYDSLENGPNVILDAEMMRQGAAVHDLNTGEQIGTVIVATGVGFYNKQQEQLLNGVSNALVVSGIIAGIFGLLVAAVIAREVTSPIRAVTDAALKLANGQRTEPLVVETSDEVGQMSQTFNQMAEALETQRELRRQLVNDLAHELGTPLSVIQLEMKALRAGQQTAEKTYAQVQLELDLLRNLVNDLDLLAAEQAHLKLSKEPLELAYFTGRAVERWQPPAEANQIALQFISPEEPLPHTAADISRLIQVLGNLINNALRHTPPHGRVTVHCQQTTLSELGVKGTAMPTIAFKKTWLVTTIQDSGEGIPAADLPHLFERFYRTQETRNRHSGRGLGLAIVKQIIEAHGGYVWVDSVLGEGSTFGYCLPIVEEGSNW